MSTSDVLAGLALIVSSIGFYFQFFWKKNGAMLTFLGAELRPDHQRFTARLCITNTGDTPLVLTEIVPLLFDDPERLSGRSPGQSASEPKMPLSVLGRSHCIVTIISDLTNAFGLLHVRTQTPYIDEALTLEGGVSLKLITADGQTAFGIVRLFHLGVSTNGTHSTHSDTPVDLLARGVLKRSGTQM